VDGDSREFDVHGNIFEFNVVSGLSSDGHGVFLSFDGVLCKADSAELNSGSRIGTISEVVGDSLEGNEGIQLRRLYSVNVDGYDVSEFVSSKEIIVSFELLEGFNIYEDLFKVFEEVGDSLHGVISVREGSFDGLEPSFSFSNGLLAIGISGP